MKLHKPFLFVTAALVSLTLNTGAYANGHGASWNLVGGDSKVAFGSIKAGVVGESHRFNELTGTVNDHGAASIEIDLTSVNTGIEIRDTRMKSHVFEEKNPTGTLTANIDPKTMTELAPGATSLIEVAGKLALGDNTIDVNTKLFVAKLSAEKVMVTTDEMVMVGVESLGITAGIDKLMGLAKLPSITPVSYTHLTLPTTPYV